MSRLRRITVHLGHAKTGTSAIQSIFFNNRHKLLEKYGILYPGDEPNHYHLQTAFSANPLGLIQVQRRGIRSADAAAAIGADFRRTLCREVSEWDPEQVVLSSEYFASMGNAELREMEQFLIGICPTINYVIYVRDPWSASVSEIQQQIVDGYACDPIRFHYAGNIGVLRHFHNTLMRPMSAYIYLQGGGFRTNSFEHFCDLMDIDPSDLDVQAVESNIAVDFETACILSYFNRIDPVFEKDGTLIDSPSRDIYRNVLVSASRRGGLALSRAAGENITAGAQSDLEWLKAAYPSLYSAFIQHFDVTTSEKGSAEIGIEHITASRAAELCLRVRIHNQNMTTAAKAHADRKTFGHLS